jgi:hypothetical protein
MTHRELLIRMSSDEISEWIAFNQLHPLPNPWLQTGQICSTVANCSLAKLKKPVSAEDFMPQYKEVKKSNPASVVRAMWNALTK